MYFLFRTVDRTGPDICFIRLDFDSVQVSGPDLVFDFQLKKKPLHF